MKFLVGIVTGISAGFYLCCCVLGLWLFTSVITSAVKADKNDCGSRYGIERYHVDGDFFCKR